MLASSKLLEQETLRPSTQLAEGERLTEHEENARLDEQRLVSLLAPMITILRGPAIAGRVPLLLLAMLNLNDLPAG